MVFVFWRCNLKKYFYKLFSLFLAAILFSTIILIDTSTAWAATGDLKYTSQYNDYSSRWYYDHLDNEQHELYQAWVDACNDALVTDNDIVEFQNIDVYCIDSQKLTSVSYAKAEETYLLLRLDNPQYFFLPNYLLHITYPDGSEEAGICTYPKFADGKLRIATKNKMFKTLRSWQKQIVKAKSVKSKMCKMHDIIIKKTSYDYSITDLNNDDVDMSQSICSVFLDKSAICY